MVSDRGLAARVDAEDAVERIGGVPDVRGWEVTAADGMKLGRVDRLLADNQTNTVRYLVVDLAADQNLRGPDRHILIPIGYALLDEPDGRVRVDELRASQLVDFPLYSGQPLTASYELSVLRLCDPDYTGGVEGIYEHSLLNPNRFYSPERRG